MFRSFLIVLQFSDYFTFFSKKIPQFRKDFANSSFTPGELLKSTPTLLKIVELTLI